MICACHNHALVDKKKKKTLTDLVANAIISFYSPEGSSSCLAHMGIFWFSRLLLSFIGILFTPFFFFFFLSFSQMAKSGASAKDFAMKEQLKLNERLVRNWDR